MKLVSSKIGFRFISLPKLIKKTHSYGKSSIRYKLTVLVIMIVFIPMSLAGVYFYSVQSSTLTNNFNKDLIQLIDQINKRIESNFGIINDASLLFLANPIIKDSLEQKSPEEDTYAEVERKRIIEDQLSYSMFYNYAWDISLIKSIFIFNNTGQYYYLLRHNIADIDQLDNNIEIYKQAAHLQEQTRIFPPTVEDSTIYFVRRITDLNRKNLSAHMIFGIDESVLGKIYEDISQYHGTQTFIFDDSGIILSSTDKSLLGKHMDPIFLEMENPPLTQELSIGGVKYFVVLKEIKRFNFVSCIMIPKNEILSSLSENTNTYIYLIMVLIMLSIIVGAYLSSMVIKPVNTLMNNISKVKDGDFTVKMGYYKEYELNQLSEVFNKMTDEIQHLFHQVYEKQLLIKEAELKSLQSQINPHFLFNVLETISWNARESNNETIYKMVSYLGKILRANITIGTYEKITIREELEYIRFYIYLQETRFRDKLDVTISVKDDSILDFYLPKLCVQPLVENAIVHGIEGKIGKGCVNINVTNDSSSIYFEIVDDGIGFDASRLNINIEDSVRYRKEGHSSIGIYNSNKRIKLLYGDEYGIFIQSRPYEGTKVTVRIPVDRGEI